MPVSLLDILLKIDQEDEFSLLFLILGTFCSTHYE
jgi:hypothetical protein